MRPLYIHGYALVSCLGDKKEAQFQNMMEKKTSGMKLRDDLVYGKSLRFGTIDSHLLPTVPKPFLDMACNRILLNMLTALKEEAGVFIDRYGKDRIAVVAGSSNTGIEEGQQAIEKKMETGRYPENFDYEMLELGSPAKFAADFLGLTGPHLTVSTACSSSLKALSTAYDMMACGVCEAALVCGVDSLCTYASNGFFSLEALSEGFSNPFGRDRDGITLGEGGAVFLVSFEKPEKKDGNDILKIMGLGETSDAYHMTSPMPDGKIAAQAMEMALKEADLSPDQIGYVGMHGTGTRLSDRMESAAVYGIFKDGVPAASMKPLIGHTLGACGAVELAFLALMLDRKINPDGQLYPQCWDGKKDPECAPVKIAGNERNGNLKYVLKNAFAFGGSNACAVIGREDE